MGGEPPAARGGADHQGDGHHAGGEGGVGHGLGMTAGRHPHGADHESREPSPLAAAQQDEAEEHAGDPRRGHPQRVVGPDDGVGRKPGGDGAEGGAELAGAELQQEGMRQQQREEDLPGGADRERPHRGQRQRHQVEGSEGSGLGIAEQRLPGLHI